MDEYIEVVGGVVQSGGRILACRRNADRSGGGLWEFPGGKIERNESSEQALARELLEELGVHVTVAGLLTRTEDHQKSVRLSLYACVPVGDLPTKSTDHDRVEWFEPDELSSLCWTPADEAAIAEISRLTRRPPS